MINYTYVINLDRHEDRWNFMQGVLASLNFPLHRVIRLSACDGKDYPTVDAVNKAAAADGFEYFLDQDYMNELNPIGLERYEILNPNKYMIAANWSYARAWREVANQDDDALLLIDDHQPVFGWTFERFDKLTVHLQYDDKQQFRLLQLNAQPLPYLKYDRTAFGSILRRGFGGIGDFGFVMSKMGAQMLLDMHPMYGITSRCLEAIIRSGQEQGCWHTIDNLVEYQYGFESARLI